VHFIDRQAGRLRMEIRREYREQQVQVAYIAYVIDDRKHYLTLT
jgi:hypothetical protein